MDPLVYFQSERQHTLQLGLRQFAFGGKEEAPQVLGGASGSLKRA